jgi:MoxR-like ATPase
VLERDGILQIDEMPGSLKDKQFHPDPRTIIMLADNVVGTGDGVDKFAATQIQDSSTLNRVDLVIKIDYMSPEKEAEMLTNRYAFLPPKQAQKMVAMANTVRQAANSGQVEVTMSPRNLMAWAEMALALKDYGQAFRYVMLERYADSNEQATVRGFWTTVYGEKL